MQRKMAEAGVCPSNSMCFEDALADIANMISDNWKIAKKYSSSYIHYIFCWSPSARHTGVLANTFKGPECLVRPACLTLD